MAHLLLIPFFFPYFFVQIFFLLLSDTAKIATATTAVITATITYRVSKGRNIPGLDSGVGVIEVDGLGVGTLCVGLGFSVDV